MAKIFAIALMLFVFLPGCKVDCFNAYIVPVFVGFSSSDIDTFVVRQFEPDNTFLHLIDTVLITSNLSNASYTSSNDSTTVVLNVISGVEKYLMPNSDWQIYIPAKNRTILISNIISPQVESKCFGDGCGCVNPIDSFTQDGKTIFPQRAYAPYIGYEYVTYINN